MRTTANLLLIFFSFKELGNLTSFISMKVKDIWQSGVDRIAQTSNGTSQSGHITRRPHIRRNHYSSDATIVFVLPLAGRFQTYLRFLRNYELTCLQHPETQTELLIILFDNGNDSRPQSFLNEITQLQSKYSKATMNLIQVDGNFSRGIALNRAIYSDYIEMGDIIFFIDVDITFKRMSIDRIRLNTIRHRQAYFPIVFGQYDPNVWQTTPITDELAEDHETDLNSETGYFRQFGFGICAMYKADILHPGINGFEEITGWGLEDVRFLEKIVKLEPVPLLTILKQQNANTTVAPLSLHVFRAPDPTLVHIYHDVSCDKSLSESQYAMCLGTKASTLGSLRYIERIFMGNQSIIQFSRTKS